MRPTSVTISSVANSAWIPVDYTQSNFNLGLQVIATGTATWSVQCTMDDIFDPSITPTATNVPSPMDAGTVSEIGNSTVPCRAVRLSVTGWTSGTVTLTVIQGRK